MERTAPLLYYCHEDRHQGRDALAPLKSRPHRSLHTNPLRHPMLGIHHPRRRSNDLQRTQDRPSSINRFPPRVAIMPYRYDQRRWTRRFGPLFGLRVDFLLRPLPTSRGQFNRLHGHTGPLLGFFLLQRLLLLLLLLIGGSKGADSTLDQHRFPYHLHSFLEHSANDSAVTTADEGARTLRLALSADCLRSGSCAGRVPARQLRARDAWPPCQSGSSFLSCR